MIKWVDEIADWSLKVKRPYRVFAVFALAFFLCFGLNLAVTGVFFGLFYPKVAFFSSLVVGLVGGVGNAIIYG